MSLVKITTAKSVRVNPRSEGKYLTLMQVLERAGRSWLNGPTPTTKIPPTSKNIWSTYGRDTYISVGSKYIHFGNGADLKSLKTISPRKFYRQQGIKRKMIREIKRSFE